MHTQHSASSSEVQEVVHKLYTWVKRMWTPSKESFIHLGRMYTEFEWKKFFAKYDSHHPKLAQFVAEGMQIFAERELA